MPAEAMCHKNYKAECFQKNDSPDNYKEITDAEADEIRNEMERLAKEAQVEQEQ